MCGRLLFFAPSPMSEFAEGDLVNLIRDARVEGNKITQKQATEPVPLYKCLDPRKPLWAVGSSEDWEPAPEGVRMEKVYQTPKWLAQHLFYAIAQDLYPFEAVELVFGIRKDTPDHNALPLPQLPIGVLVYNVWHTLLRWCSWLTEEAVARALHEETLPQLLVQGIEECLALHPQLAYLEELHRRGYDDIVWDRRRFPTTAGVRIVGDTITAADVFVDSAFEPVPIACAVGLPIIVRREQPTGDRYKRYAIVRMMSDPDVGVAHREWQYGGACGPAPPVVAARKDGLPLTVDEWMLLDDFEMAMLDPGPRRVLRKDLARFIADAMGGALRCGRPAHAFLDVVQALDVRYPKGARVRTRGLQTRALEGAVGVVEGRYERGRVGVLFPEPFGLKAVRPRNLLPECPRPA